MSMPTPCAPYIFAAVMTMRPSPEPRSYTTSVVETFASLSIALTTSLGVGTNTTSGCRAGADCCAKSGVMKTNASRTAQLKVRSFMRSSVNAHVTPRSNRSGKSYPQSSMAVIVQKYGGSSVADLGKLKRVAERVMETRELGHHVVVVVSAMGDTTDDLLGMAKKISANPHRRELDMLLSAGERISMALLSLAIQELGGDAISFTGSQSGIITNDRHVDARIIEVRPFRVQDELARGKIVVVAGYQGVSYRKEVTTLGRGGSDTTAVAMAAALDAEFCEICSDVDGVYSADPRVVSAARRIGTLSYEETQEMAEAGAK